MVIQHNLPAMNAHRYLGLNNAATAKNLEKLSSGYRINRAADDAAGLAISEKMRGQIRGLSMAEQNVSHAVNLIQTAEGALNETHSIIQRMRELAVQSSNGTYQDEDRALITKEFEALKSEVNRIAESTHYNGIKLLDGSLGGSASSRLGKVSESTITKMQGAIGLGNDLAIQQFTVDKGVAEVYLTSDLATEIGALDPEGVDSSAAAVVRDVKIDFIDESGNNQSITVRIDNLDKATNKTIDWSDGADATATLVAALNKTDLAKYFKIADDGSGELEITSLKTGEEGAAHIGKITVTRSLEDLQGLNGTYAENKKAMYDAADALKGSAESAAITGAIDTTAIAAGIGVDTTVWASTTADGFKMGDSNLNWFELAGQKFVWTNEFDTGSTDGKGGTYLRVAADPATMTEGEAALISKAMEGALGLKVVVGYGDDTAGYVEGTTAFSGTGVMVFAESANATSGTNAAGALVFQIGANGGADQRVSLSVNDMSAKGIGIEDAHIDTIANANAAITKLEASIITVSGQRADLGALQNRLEHTMNSLGVAKENLTAAESTIRDVDMAKEMMEFTKNNILVQASQAMLAQANQLPQGVLQLLR